MAGGLAGLVYSKVLGTYLKNRPRSYLTERIEQVHERFQRRTSFSWLLLIFGFVWSMQLVVENWSGNSDLGVSRALASSAVEDGGLSVLAIHPYKGEDGRSEKQSSNRGVADQGQDHP